MTHGCAGVKPRTGPHAVRRPKASSCATPVRQRWPGCRAVQRTAHCIRAEPFSQWPRRSPRPVSSRATVDVAGGPQARSAPSSIQADRADTRRCPASRSIARTRLRIGSSHWNAGIGAVMLPVRFQDGRDVREKRVFVAGGVQFVDQDSTCNSGAGRLGRATHREPAPRSPGGGCRLRLATRARRRPAHPGIAGG